MFRSRTTTSTVAASIRALSATALTVGLLATCGTTLVRASAIADPDTSTEAPSSAEASAKPFAVRADLQPVPGSASAAEIRACEAISAVPKRFQYAFRLNMRGVYDDNIFLRHENRVGDVYFAIEPAVTLGFGDIVGADMNSVRLDYAASIFLYGDHTEANAIQHLIRLEAHYRFGHLSLALNQDVQLLEGANRDVTNFSTSNTTPTLNLDTGGNAQVNIYTTNATFSYDLSGKTFLSGGLHFTAQDYETLISSESFQGNVFINYIYSPKLTVGLGGTWGYNWVEQDNPDQMFEQVNLRTTYQLSGKVNLDASVGVEFRQFENDVRGSTYISPVYELGARYQPFDGTTVTVRGARRTQNSAVFAGQDYASTNLTVGIRQRFLRRIYLGLTGGYERSEYFKTSPALTRVPSEKYSRTPRWYSGTPPSTRARETTGCSAA